jgi:DNA-binding NarL/FixJ family response regulator
MDSRPEPWSVTRILIASDVRLYSEGIRQFLSGTTDLEVIGIVADTTEAIRQVSESSPDVVLLDQALPRGLEVLRALRELQSPCRVVALGVPDHEEILLTWAEAGVAGFVPRDATVESLRDTISSAARGELNCSARVAGTLLQRLQHRARDLPDLPPRLALTNREVEIVQLVDQGMSNKEIAARLGIEIATVKNHVHNVLEKLQVHRRAEAAARLRGRDPRRPTPIIPWRAR